MLLSLFLACPSETVITGDPKPGTDTLDVSLSASPAFDPLAGAPYGWDYTGEDASVSAAAKVLAADGSVVAAGLDDTWDGKNSAGQLVSPGAYTLVVGSGEAERTAPVAVVRTGVQAVWAEDDDGATATRVPLYWSQRRQAQEFDEALVELDAIDTAAGDTLPVPDVGESLSSAESDAMEPTAYTYDSRPIVALSFAAQSALGATGLEGAALEVVVDGWTAVGSATPTGGGTLTFQRNEALGTTLGVTDEVLVLQVLAVADDGTRWPVNELSVPMRFYRLLDSPTWDESGEKYLPWVAAIDPALRGIEGTAANRDAVADALVKWVFEENALEYDTRYGASAYTTYSRNDWEEANFDLGSFLTRRFGSVVNCTDCAGIMVAFANMLGARTDYAIIGFNFDLDYILAIGGEEYTHCPFGSGGCGFSYHAVSVDSSGDFVWDATLALDGDSDPGAAPHTELLVQGIPAEEYLDRLARTPTSYQYQAQGSLQ